MGNSLMKKILLVFGIVVQFTFMLINLSARLNAQEIFSIKSTNTYKRIKSAIDKIRVIDCHEHLWTEKRLLSRGTPDFFDVVLRSYVRTDISIMGNTFPSNKKYLDKSLSIEERWNSFLPIYDRLKNTGYMRGVQIGLKKVHGIDVVDASSIKKINESLKKTYKPGIYKKILYDLGKIDCLLTNRDWVEGYPADDFPFFIKGVRNFDNLVLLLTPEEVHKIEKRYDHSIRRLEDLEIVYRKFIDETIASGVIGIKCDLAYNRSIDFIDYTRENAESFLNKLITHTKPYTRLTQPLSIEEATELSNYCVHLMMKIIEEKGLFLSVHTGLQNRDSTDIRKSNPQDLIPLFRKYKNLNFDVFHGGFPYTTEFIELGKSWSNVFLNLCWNHIISPEGTRVLLSELLECVPVNKILAFGGDVYYPEAVIGHLEIAKENCAVVLAQKVIDSYFSEKDAIEFAERILRTNAIEFYKLNIKKPN